VAGYREHLARQVSRAGEARQRRHLSDQALLVQIKAIHAEMRGCYGWPRICKELQARGLRVGKDRQPARSAHRAQPARPAVHAGRAGHGLGR
jgi:putative transposase